MNNLRKASALKKYAPTFVQGLNAEQLRAVISADEKGYKDEEISEIIEALQAGETPDESLNPEEAAKETPLQATTTGEAKTINKIYEEYNVELQYDEETDEDTGVKTKKLKKGDARFLKVGRPVRTTSIDPEKAAHLNAHSITTKRRYYLKDGQK